MPLESGIDVWFHIEDCAFNNGLAKNKGILKPCLKQFKFVAKSE